MLIGFVLQLVTEENVKGVVSLTQDYEMEDFTPTEQVMAAFAGSPIDDFWK